VLEPAEFGVILFWDPSALLFRPQAASGSALHDRDAVLAINLAEGESIMGSVFAEGKARLLSTPEEVTREMSNLHPAKRTAMIKGYGLDRSPKCLVAVPLRKDEHHGPACFSDDDLPFIQALADLIALEIDRARLDAEVAVAQQVQEEDRLRSEVMAALSHELRTPLASIKGYATALMLKEVNWPEEKRQEFLRLIDEETNNLERMVSDIMDASLIDIGQLNIEPQPLRLPRLAEEVAQEIQHHSSRHNLVVDFPASFPIVDADPRRIRQVFLNILDNAIKYSPEGGLTVIRGEVRPTDVVVSIADQGVGISPEDLIPLFDKYFRVKAPTGYHVSGTGLGLPVARAIVETHGGRIWAKSKVGEGTTLYFSIPLKLESKGVGTEVK
jgi:K+-sensing histidine kinase KdpD